MENYGSDIQKHAGKRFLGDKMFMVTERVD